jgi:hypothetical protein
MEEIVPGRFRPDEQSGRSPEVPSTIEGAGSTDEAVKVGT